MLAVLLALLVGMPLASAQDAALRWSRMEPRLGLAKPDGDGPFPAVVMVPGCQGLDHALYRGRYDRVARDLQALGFVSVRADYITALQAGTCDGIIDPAGSAQDVLAVARHVASLPFVKPDAVNLLGWSYGAGLVLGLVEQFPPGAHRPVAAVVAYTPYLAMFRPWPQDFPVLILCSLQDSVAPCDRTDLLVGELPQRQSLRYVKLPEGLHGFDNADLPEQTTATGNRAGYHPTAARAAWEELTRFLRR